MRISDWSSDVCSSDLLRAWLFGVSPGVIYYGRRMNALCALAAAGYPTALELHHPPRGSAQSAQLQAFAVQAGFLGLVVISEQLRTEILRLLPNLDPASVLVAHDGARGDRRSEEHTSELQSLMRISYAVFCLKKKTKIPHQRNWHID